MSNYPIDKSLKSGGHVRLSYGTLYVEDGNGDSVRLDLDQAVELLPCLEAMIALAKVRS